jgi:rhomboid family protein
MGIYDRDYYRDDQQTTGFAALQMWSITIWLIVINIAVYVIDQASHGQLSDWGYFSQATAVNGLQIWRFITFQFLHDLNNLGHIFFNMLALYFFGPIVENYLGPRKYLAFYLICGIGGTLAYMVLNLAGFFSGGPETALVGASAGIFGVLVGAATVAPNVTVLMMMIIPMRLRTAAWVMVAIAAYTVFSNGFNAGGQASHLGGALVGLILIHNDRLLDFANFRRSRLKYGGRRASFRDWSKDLDR